jgi:hypothetical protein
MSFLHKDFRAGPSDIIVVNLDTQVNVLLLDTTNYNAYCQGRQYRYIGGLAKQTPARLRPPHTGHWHVVVDLGGRSGRIRADIRILSS